MTHASEGQYDTSKLEFHRIKVSHWQWHALRVLSSSVEAESVGALVLWKGPRRGTCPQKSNWEWPCWSRAEPGGLPRWLMAALQMEEVSCRAQVKGDHWAEASTRQAHHWGPRLIWLEKALRQHVVCWAESTRSKDLIFFSLFLEILHI